MSRHLIRNGPKVRVVAPGPCKGLQTSIPTKPVQRHLFHDTRPLHLHCHRLSIPCLCLVNLRSQIRNVHCDSSTNHHKSTTSHKPSQEQRLPLQASQNIERTVESIVTALQASQEQYKPSQADDKLFASLKEILCIDPKL